MTVQRCYECVNAGYMIIQYTDIYVLDREREPVMCPTVQVYRYMDMVMCPTVQVYRYMNRYI